MPVHAIARASARQECEAFLTESLEGFHRHRIAAGNAAKTVSGELRRVRQCLTFFGRPPWECARDDADAYGAMLVGRYQPSTVRYYQAAVRRYFAFLCDPEYPWRTECERRFGITPRQLFTAENTFDHTTVENNPTRRALLTSELQRLFATIVAQMNVAAATHRKGYWAAARDLTILAVSYGWGLRAKEVANLCDYDLLRSPDETLREAYGRYGALHIRYAKARRHGVPRQRDVLSVHLFAWAIEILRWYCEEIRPRDPHRHDHALFVTERGTVTSSAYVSSRFKRYRSLAELEDTLTHHCLRHTYITKLAENDFPILFIQTQVGHGDASVTALYTTVSDSFKRRIARRAYEALRS